MRRSALVIFVWVGLAACGGGGNADGGMDAPPVPDGSMDLVGDGIADGSTDLTSDSPMDGLGMDGTTPDGGGPDGGPGGIVCDPGNPCGALDICPLGFVCVTNACGSTTCQPEGAPCADMTTHADCASGSICEMGGVGGMICRTDNDDGTCNASTDCPPGHTCDSGACARRFLPCNDEDDCPRSYACLAVSGDSQGCVYVYRPCTSVGICSGISMCGDVDGDGSNECGGGGSCTQNTDCSGTDRCVFTGAGIMCLAGGLCDPAGAPCPGGHTCVDLHGDGFFECVPTGGSCGGHTDCAAGSLCAVPADGSAPRCFDP